MALDLQTVEGRAKYHIKWAMENIQKHEFKSRDYYIYRSKLIIAADIIGMPMWEIVDYLKETFPDVPADKLTDDLEFDEWVEWSCSEDKRKQA